VSPLRLSAEVVLRSRFRLCGRLVRRESGWSRRSITSCLWSNNSVTHWFFMIPKAPVFRSRRYRSFFGVSCRTRPVGIVTKQASCPHTSSRSSFFYLKSGCTFTFHPTRSHLLSRHVFAAAQSDSGGRRAHNSPVKENSPFSRLP